MHYHRSHRTLNCGVPTLLSKSSKSANPPPPPLPKPPVGCERYTFNIFTFDRDYNSSYLGCSWWRWSWGRHLGLLWRQCWTRRLRSGRRARLLRVGTEHLTFASWRVQGGKRIAAEVILSGLCEIKLLYNLRISRSSIKFSHLE